MILTFFNSSDGSKQEQAMKRETLGGVAAFLGGAVLLFGGAAQARTSIRTESQAVPQVPSWSIRAGQSNEFTSIAVPEQPAAPYALTGEPRERQRPQDAWTGPGDVMYRVGNATVFFPQR